MAIQEEDVIYFRLREQEERDRAELATVQESRQIHQILAEKYNSLAVKAEQHGDARIRNIAPDGLLLAQSV